MLRMSPHFQRVTEEAKAAAAANVRRLNAFVNGNTKMVVLEPSLRLSFPG